MKWELLIPLLFILFIGIPHGASDILIARRRFKNSWLKILFFLISYLFVAIIFTTAWFFYPILCLGVFLFISGLHFGLLDTIKMPTSSLKLIQALIYGLTPIIIPIVFHTREVNEIFKLLLFDENNDIAYQIQHFFLLWLLGLIIFFVKSPESSQRQVLEIITLATLLVTMPPLWGFAFYFCFVHSIRHYLNLRKELNYLETFDVIALFMTSMATITLVALAGFLLKGNGIEESLLKVTFIGLAALTVPHMLLVDLYPRIRLRALKRTISLFFLIE